MKKYEYSTKIFELNSMSSSKKREEADAGFIQFLNNCASEGWRLVTAMAVAQIGLKMSVGGGIYCVFERELE